MDIDVEHDIQQILKENKAVRIAQELEETVDINYKNVLKKSLDDLQKENKTKRKIIKK